MTDDNPYQSPEHIADSFGQRPAIWFRRFRRAFLWWGAFPLLLTVMQISTDRDPRAFLLLTTTWWLVGLSLVFRINAGFFTAFALVCLLWLVGCYEIVRRIMFAVENQGFEGVGGLGSPLAFTLGLLFELCFLFVPMSILLGLGVAALRSRRS